MSESTLPTEDLTTDDALAGIAAENVECASCDENPFGLGPRLFDPAKVTDMDSLAEEIAAVLNPMVRQIGDIEQFCRWAHHQIGTTTQALDEAQQALAGGGIGAIMKLLKG